jgi:hypothetical protein
VTEVTIKFFMDESSITGIQFIYTDGPADNLCGSDTDYSASGWNPIELFLDPSTVSSIAAWGMELNEPALL